MRVARFVLVTLAGSVAGLVGGYVPAAVVLKRRGTTPRQPCRDSRCTPVTSSCSSSAWRPPTRVARISLVRLEPKP